MNTFVVENAAVRIPTGIKTLKAFRRWFHSPTFPDEGRICFFQNEVWVDMSKEQVFSHNQVKQEYNLVLGGLAKTHRQGRYFPDGLLVTNAVAGLAVQPDGTFASFEAFRTERVRLIEGTIEGFLELEGTPDMVLEVVSASSVLKDTEILRDLYWQAGIPEYWLVDARKEKLQFDILRHTSDSYVPVRKQNGWLKSQVFGKSFKLTRRTDEAGNPEYVLEIR